jgi:hypothetical protein
MQPLVSYNERSINPRVHFNFSRLTFYFLRIADFVPAGDDDDEDDDDDEEEEEEEEEADDDDDDDDEEEEVVVSVGITCGSEYSYCKSVC